MTILIFSICQLCKQCDHFISTKSPNFAKIYQNLKAIYTKVCGITKLSKWTDFTNREIYLYHVSSLQQL